MNKCYYCRFGGNGECSVIPPTIVIERRLFRKDKITQVRTKVEPDDYCDKYESYRRE